MIHLFASDYDGTLYHDGKISKGNLEAIEAFRKLGHKFGIITGRSINSILDEVNEHKIPFDFISGINGGVVLDHNLKEIQIHKMNEDVVMDVLKTIDSFGVRLYGLNDGYDHITVQYHDILNKVHIESFDRIYDNGITGMYVGCHTNEDALKVYAMINTKYADDDIKSYANESYVDVATIFNSKATGVEVIMDHYDITGSAYTVGDSYNDVPMLRDFNGFLMGNGVTSLAKFASAGVVDTVQQAITLAIQDIEG